MSITPMAVFGNFLRVKWNIVRYNMTILRNFILNLVEINPFSSS